MKILKKTLAYILVSGSLFSCASLVDGSDISPNVPGDVEDPAVILRGLSVANIMFHAGNTARYAGIWSGYFAGNDRQYVDFHNYVTTAGDYDDSFLLAYFGVIAQTRIIMKKAEEDKNFKMKGVAQVIEAQTAGVLTSLWGDVPYSQAADYDRYPNPAYDKQSAVYASLQTMLDDAIKNFKSAGIIEGDIYYDGDAEKWLKLAYSLKARFYTHTKEYTKALEASSKGILAGGDDYFAYFRSSGDEGTPNARNVYYEFMVLQRRGYMVTSPLLKPFLDGKENVKTQEDGRMNSYMTPKFALNTGVGGFFYHNAPFPMFLAEETLLIAAEASHRLGKHDDALSFLNKARKQGQSRYEGNQVADYTISDFEAGGIAAVSGKTKEESLLVEIMKEKHAALFAQIEDFNDLRRTKNILNIPSNVTGETIPQRFLYPQTEVNANKNFPGTVDLRQPTEVNQ